MNNRLINDCFFLCKETLQNEKNWEDDIIIFFHFAYVSIWTKCLPTTSCIQMHYKSICLAFLPVPDFFILHWWYRFDGRWNTYTKSNRFVQTVFQIYNPSYQFFKLFQLFPFHGHFRYFFYNQFDENGTV